MVRFRGAGRRSQPSQRFTRMNCDTPREVTLHLGVSQFILVKGRQRRHAAGRLASPRANERHHGGYPKKGVPEH